MFIFVSKLLPLFIYPLGLSCILLLFALWLSKERSRKTYIPILLAFVILTVAGNSIVANNLIFSLEKRYPALVDPPSAEAIVVLGGATRNNEPPRILADLNERGDRLLYAAKLYKDGAAPKILLSGGRISWTKGNPSEANDMAAILELIGIPPEDLILESRSFNTHENAIFTKEILQEQNIKKVLLVTSAAHMPRAIAIFRHENIDVIPAPTDFLVSERNLIEHRYTSQSRIFSLIPNTQSLDYTTQAMKEYLGTFIYRLKGWL